MTRDQRYRYEMFVRVRKFGTMNPGLFPEASSGSRALEQINAVLNAFEEHLKDHVLGKADAKVKETTREAAFDYMKTMAKAARRVTEAEPGSNPFKLPRHRSLTAEIATAQAFLQEASTRQEAFVEFGLPSTFMTDFGVLVDQLKDASETRLSSKTALRRATAGIAAAAAEGLKAVLDLDVIVAMATRTDPATFAVWKSTRRVDRRQATEATTADGAAEDPVPPATDQAA